MEALLDYFEIDEEAQRLEWREYSEPGKSYFEQRNERLKILVNSFSLLGKIKQSQNMFHESYAYLSQGLSCLNQLAQDDIAFEFVKILEQEEFQSNAKGKKGDPKKKPEKKEPKKDAKPKAQNKKPGKGGKSPVETDITQILNVLSIDVSRTKSILPNQFANHGINCQLWLKLKCELSEVLFELSNYQALEKYLEVFKQDCKRLSDRFYLRKAQGIEARLLLVQGQ